MSTTKTLDVAVGEYVGRCIEHLRDLPDTVQDEILDDIRQMVAEVSAELDGNPSDLLGPPDRFVEELRTAAGFASENPSPALSPRGAGAVGRDIATFLRERLRSVDVIQWLRTLLLELRPAGWVLRGYAFGALVAFALSDGMAEALWLFGVLPIPKLSGSAIWGGLVTAAVVAASVELGRRRPRGWWKLALIGASVASVLVLGATTRDLRAQDLIRSDSGVVAADYAEPVMVDQAVTEATMAPTPEEAAPVFLVDTNSGNAIAATTISDARNAWLELAAGRPEYPINVSYQGYEAVAMTPDDLTELLFSFGMPGE